MIENLPIWIITFDFITHIFIFLIFLQHQLVNFCCDVSSFFEKLFKLLIIICIHFKQALYVLFIKLFILAIFIYIINIFL